MKILETLTELIGTVVRTGLGLFFFAAASIVPSDAFDVTITENFPKNHTETEMQFYERDQNR